MFDGWDLVAEPPPLERDFQTVVVAGRRFGVPADVVRGQLGPMTPTPVPGAGRAVRGVLMWEGQVVPVIATSVRLELPVLREPTGGRPLLQLEIGGETFFLEVDAIEGVIAGSRLEPLTTDVPMVAGFIEGDETAGARDKVPVIDLDALVNIGEDKQREIA